MEKNNYFEASKALRKICKPLFSVTPISFFAYSRFYSNREFEFIIVNPDVLEDFLENKHYLSQLQTKKLEDYATGFVYDAVDADSESSAEYLKQARECYNISHSLAYQERHQDYCDFFTFGTTVERDKVNDLYLSKRPFLKKFCQLGLPVFRKIITHYNLPKVKIPYLESDTVMQPRYKLGLNRAIELFIDLIQLQQLDNEQVQHFKITEREVDCLKVLLENKTAKQAARELHISHRTIEHHYERLKCKLGLSSKAALKELFDYEKYT